MNAIDRKNGHIDLALAQEIEQSDFARWRLKHRALPEVNFQEINLGTTFLGQRLKAPIFVSSMTGGPARAERINQSLAIACRELGLAMGVGSQRIALETANQSGINRSIRECIGRQPLMANYGAINLAGLTHPSDLGRIIDPLEADGLILHLNPMQEIFQAHGDTNWKHVIDRIKEVCDWSPIPVIVKEVGFGLDAESASLLRDVGVAVLDVAGRGGTRFDQIERQLAVPDQQLPTAVAFANWGYSTVESLELCSSLVPKSALWASGGIRHGVDVAKALCLGAGACGIGGAVLPAALESPTATIECLQQIIFDLQVACYGCGIASADEFDNHHLMQEQSDAME
jgi:isopentenyl-diphosphate Delta-isomerase